MTSNLGSDIIREKFEGLNDQNREEVTEDAKEAVLELLKKTVRPEFLNRIDEIVMFSPLDEAEILSIVKIQVDSILRMLKGNGVTLNISDEALKFIAEEGYDPQFGARPVKRVIQRRLLNELSKKLISQTVQRDKPIVIDVKDGELVFEN
jgi:ATP-dependent Clp protease ATP-binding subunit ClpB